jgi:hypothetical protein
MMLARLAAALVAALTVQHAAFPQEDDEKSWLRQDDPRLLGVRAGLNDDCDVSRNALLQIMSAQLAQAGIEPVVFEYVSVPVDRLTLQGIVACVDRRFLVMVDFVDAVDSLGFRHHVFGYYHIGDLDGDEEDVEAALADTVEKALSDYLKANRDLLRKLRKSSAN